MDWSTTMKRDNLLVKLKANRDNHMEMFAEARTGYRNAAVDECERLIEQLRTGAAPTVHFALAPPENHTEDYNRIIRMLECTTQEEVTLDEEHFSCYVDDDWGWLKRWLGSNRRFSETATNYAMAKKV